MATNPRYRIMPVAPPGELCYPHQLADANVGVEAAAYAQKFCQDHWEASSLNGHIHIHHDTCFKYVEDGLRRKPQRCRFNFVHFVHLWVKKKESDSDPKLITVMVVSLAIAIDRLSLHIETLTATNRSDSWPSPVK